MEAYSFPEQESLTGLPGVPQVSGQTTEGKGSVVSSFAQKASAGGIFKLEELSIIGK